MSPVYTDIPEAQNSQRLVVIRYDSSGASQVGFDSWYGRAYLRPQLPVCLVFCAMGVTYERAWSAPVATPGQEDAMFRLVVSI